VNLLLPGVQEDPRPWLATATLYVQPSLSEGASNAVLEAMAAGVPIVASDVGGMRELLGNTGVLVTPGDARSLRDAMAHLLASRTELRRLGDAARGRARERFSEDAVITTTISVYKGELPCAAS
jgi:glycosyltransferase involved in cell wall biosynthesis